MIRLKFVAQEESVDSESALYGNDDTGFEYNPVPVKSNNKKRKTKDNDDDCKVIHEKDVHKSNRVGIVKVKDDPTKNPQPFYLKLIPLVRDILRYIEHSGQKDFFETTVEITSARAMELIAELDERYTKMSASITPLHKYNIMKGSNIRIPHTEVYTCEESDKEKMKVQVSVGVNSWMHKYCDSFNIELSDAFSIFVLYSYMNKKDLDDESKNRCKEAFNQFLKHVDDKIEKLSDAPPEFSSIIPCYLDLLQALGMKQKNIYVNHTGGKGTVIFKPDISRNTEKRSRNVTGSIFKKNTNGKSSGVEEK